MCREHTLKRRRYKISNWSNYNNALVNRGSLTLWFDEKSIRQWHKPQKTLLRGRIPLYSDIAIEFMLTLKAVFHLPFLRQIRKIGRPLWKKQSGYHRRSIAETTMFRFKKILNGHLKAITFQRQAAEAFIKCNVLNKMTALGMPQAYPVI